MNKSLRLIGMRLTLLILVLASVLVALPVQASEHQQQQQSVVHVQWETTEQEYQELLAELKGLDTQIYEDGATAPFSDVPVTASWTSEEMSAKELAEWVKSQPYQSLIPVCVTVRMSVRVWFPVIGYRNVEVSVTVCADL